MQDVTDVVYVVDIVNTLYFLCEGVFILSIASKPEILSSSSLQASCYEFQLFTTHIIWLQWPGRLFITVSVRFIQLFPHGFLPLIPHLLLRLLTAQPRVPLECGAGGVVSLRRQALLIWPWELARSVRQGYRQSQLDAVSVMSTPCYDDARCRKESSQQSLHLNNNTGRVTTQLLNAIKRAASEANAATLEGHWIARLLLGSKHCQSISSFLRHIYVYLDIYIYIYMNYMNYMSRCVNRKWGLLGSIYESVSRKQVRCRRRSVVHFFVPY